MTLGKLSILLGVPLAAILPAAAQASFPTIAGSDEVAAMIAKAKADIKPDSTFQVEPLKSLASHDAYVEYRTGRAVRGNTHTDDEVVYVISGSGVFALGGHLVKGGNGGPATEDQVVDGTMRPVTKGDMLLVPHGTPHQVISTQGALILMSMHIPAS